MARQSPEIRSARGTQYHRELVGDLISSHVWWALKGEEPFGPPTLAYAPGIGKTEALITALLQQVQSGSPTSVLYVAQRHDQLDAVASKLGKLATHRLGKSSESACEFPHVIRAAYAKNLDTDNVICGACPVGKACVAYAQWDFKPPIWLVTEKMLRSHRLSKSLNDRNQSEDIQWKLVVFDDCDPVSAFVRSIDVSCDDLLKASSRGQNSQPLVDLIRSIATLLATDHSLDLSGRELWTHLRSDQGAGRLIEFGSHRLPPVADAEVDVSGMPSCDELLAQPTQFMPQLARALWEEAQRFNRDEAFNSRLQIRKGRLIVREVVIPDFLRRTQVVLLGATLDIEGWANALGRNPEDIKAEMWGDEPVHQPDGVNVTQVADYFSGKGSMQSASHSKRRSAQIRRIVSSSQGKVGVITFKDEVARLQLESWAANVQFMHFGAQAGLNNLEEVDTLIVSGRPMPNPFDLSADLQALYQNDSPIGEQDGLFTWAAYSNGLDSQLYEVEVLTHPDPRFRSAMIARCEGELFQAIYRARPLTPGRSVNIYILTEHPVPGQMEIPGLNVHLTGVDGAYCPVFDDEMEAICSAANRLITADADSDAPYFTIEDLARAAFDRSDRDVQRMLRRPGVMRELEFHCGLRATKEIHASPLQNGGTGKRERWVVRRADSHGTLTL